MGWRDQWVIKSLLGVQKCSKQFFQRPSLRETWTIFDLRYRFGASTYTITRREVAASIKEAFIFYDDETPRRSIDTDQ
jgi:cellobiose phosphorylase